MNKKGAALLLAAAMTFSSIMPGQKAMAAGETFVKDSQLSETAAEAPAKDDVIPDANQYEYQKQELAAFCHFGPNTFNEIEWGEHYGDRTPDDIFKLETNFDAEKLVSALKEAGFKKLIVTAKHHDGFCIWNSEYTDYDVQSTSYADYNYDNMGGDVLAEISAACTKLNMDMGLYLSPWDIHDESYGYYDEAHNPTDKEHDFKDYNEYYNNQLIEILSNPKYGNDGRFKEVWMDGAKGSGANAQEYDFDKWISTIQKYEGKQAGYPADCMLFGAGPYTTVRWIGNENGYANEENWAKSKVDWTNNTMDSNQTGVQDTFIGYEDGNQWTVPEVDARITSGWFWGNDKKSPKSITDLGNMYFNSVGHNATLLLNIPPNNQGSVDQAILKRVAEFGDNIAETFHLNLARDAVASASEVRGKSVSYKPGNVLDGKDNTYWTVNHGTTTGILQLDLKGQKTFDVVSLEEAVQFGQRIKRFKVEYSLNGGEWKTFEQGTTIGAKRLCRKAPVKADKLRITVTTTSAEPMLSEVGIFKASNGFEKAKSAPTGMDVIGIKEPAFQFSNGWNPETGDQFLNGANSWAGAGKHVDVKFSGTKIYLVGSKDPGATAAVTIDGKPAGNIDTNVASRTPGQILFVSEDLDDSEHTLKLKITNKAVGVEGAYVINNGGKGMIGIEQASYTMNEEDALNVKLVRVGGSTGEVTVNFAPNPGSAIQDDYNTELNQNITFKEGEKVKEARVETKRNTLPTGNRYFTVALSTMDEGLILGFNDVARVTIMDAEGITVEKLNELLTECRNLNEVNYQTESWKNLAAAMQNAEQRLEAGDMSDALLKSTYEALATAKAGLVVREHYAENDRFAFPETANATVTLEAELLEQYNNTEGDNGWPLQIGQKDWASNHKFLNCLNSNDQAKLYYTAPRTGTYSAVVTYRSGDPLNAIVWEEANNNITAGNVTAGAADEAGATHTANFEFVVAKPGDGVLVFKGGERKAPQIDKIEITASKLDKLVFQVTKTAGANGAIVGPETVNEGENAAFTIQPNEGYEVQDVKVNGKSVGAVAAYTVENASADIKIEASFVKRAFKYTSENPFVFPAAAGKTEVLEAEYATLHNSGGENEQWKLNVSQADWASNHKFVDSLNKGDEITIPYQADVAGTYTVQVTFRSGSDTNYLDWSEENGKITAGTTQAGCNDSNSTQTKTFEMVVNTAGAGILKFAPKTANSPQLDKFDITLKETADSQDANQAAAVDSKIDAIGEVTLESESKITEARTAYNTLTDAQKALVTKLPVLEAAEAKLTELKQNTADKAAAEKVDEKIDALGEITLESDAAVTAARASYENLTEKQKTLVTKLSALEAAEAKLKELQDAADQEAKDQAAANGVIAMIDQIGEVTLESESKITDARTAYNALTDVQKALVGDKLAVLEMAESQLAELQDAAAQAEKDQAAAKAVVEKINAIGEVTLESESKITDARMAYDALTDAQKALVENLNVLTTAEAKLAELKKPAPTEKPVPTEKPAPTQKPVPSEKPVPTAKPAPSEKPTTTATPVPSAQPVAPAAPAASAAPTAKPANGAQTGDSSNLSLWSLMGVLSLGGAGIVLVQKKKKNRAE